MRTGLSSSIAPRVDAGKMSRPEEIFSTLVQLGEGRQRPFIVQHLRLFDDDSLLTLLKSESERYQTIDPRGALALAEALVLAGELTGRQRHRALGLLAKGDAQRCLGLYQDSVDTLEQSGRAFLALGDRVGWARTRLGWLYSSHRLGQGASALEVVSEARDILLEHHEWLRVAGLDLNTAYVCYELGQYGRALALYDEAEKMYTSLGDAAAVRAAWAKANRAFLLTFQGDFDTALRLGEEAREVFARNGDTVSVLRQDQNIALVHASQGHYTRALQRYSAALAELEDAHLDVDAAWVALNMVECYLSLNRNPEALELAAETVTKFERCGTPTEAAKARFYCALAHARMGDRDRAQMLLAEAATAFEEAGLTVQLGVAMLHRGLLHLDEGCWAEADREAEGACRLFSERGLVIRQAQADLVRARAALSRGDRGKAQQLAHAVLNTSRERDVLWLAPESHHILGRVAQENGLPDEALEEFEHAVTGIERVQTSLAMELRTNFLEDKLPVYEDAIEASLHLAEPQLALAYLERAKSRALVDYLAGNLDIQMRARSGANEELLRTLARLRAEHNWLYTRRYGYGLAQRPNSTPVEDDERLQAQILDREKQIARLIERLALDRAEGIAVEGRAEAGDFLAPVHTAPGTVLVEYFFRAGKSVAFVISSSGLHTVPLSVAPDDIRRLQGRWQLNLEATRQAMARGKPLDGLARGAVGVLAALYRALIAPLTEHLEDIEHLVVIPYGPTHAVPFHALHDGERYLIERFEVSSCPSSRLLRLCSGRPRQREHNALIVAYTNAGLLPSILQEARAVAEVMPGELHVDDAATRDVFLNRAPHHNVLHLAAHAEARLDNPTFAHIQLADGQLTTTDICNLDLTGALVTLSACETGRCIITGGDELIGLSRGFLYAGASTLVQSLWQVEDVATAALMTHFYRALRSGRAAGAALREAQRMLLDACSAHPYYWAPFQLIGDAGSPRSPFQTY